MLFCSLFLPYRLGLCVLRRKYRQDYETLFHVVILSKHHHYITDSDIESISLDKPVLPPNSVSKNARRWSTGQCVS
jgi:hypothetical protein